MEELKMDETIPGGRYKGTDGTFHDANGKPVSADGSAPVSVPVTPEPAAGNSESGGDGTEGRDPAAETGKDATAAEKKAAAAAKKAAAEKAAAEKKAAEEATKAAETGDQ